jgi:hypothetical protein
LLEAANLPRAKPRGSNIVGNVLLFLAALSVFVVVMYAVNKDAPKTESPFNAPPGSPMGRAQEPPPQREAPPAQPTAPSAQTNAPPPAAAQAGAGGGTIRGVIKVDPSLADSVFKGGAMFIILRNAGMPDRGPPVAVKKIDSPSFPAAFEVGAADVMMQGMPFSGPFDVYVRLDRDSNAMTKDPGDFAVTAPKTNVTPGAAEVEIVLDKRL